MLFNSYLFLFAFLPTVLLLYWTAGKLQIATRSLILVVASLFFYGYWNVWHVPLIVASLTLNHAIGRRIQRPSAIGPKLWLAIGCTINLALLGYYKYAGFIIETIAALEGAFGDWGSVILPLGISFFTFQQIGYLVDCYRGSDRDYSLLEFAAFVLFFPQLIAGPILQHKDLIPQLTGQDDRWLKSSDFATGVAFFVAGLFKKVLIADSLAPIANAVFDADGAVPVSFFDAWTAALAYTGQIYFDFSGYSDMAIGLGWMFSVRLPENFNSPYKATSIVDFWRRWHITLSNFLRDYLYISLGGSRCGRARRNLNLFLTMLLGGIWHGAGWTFVAWGAMHGGFLVINHTWRQLPERFHRLTSRSGLTHAFSWPLTMLCVVVSWVIFRAPNMGSATSILQAMFPIEGTIHLQSFAGLTIEDVALSLAALAACVFLPNTQQALTDFTQRVRGVLPEPLPGSKAGLSFLRWQPTFTYGVLSALIFVCCLCFLTRVNVFLYFQF